MSEDAMMEAAAADEALLATEIASEIASEGAPAASPSVSLRSLGDFYALVHSHCNLFIHWMKAGKVWVTQSFALIEHCHKGHHPAPPANNVRYAKLQASSHSNVQEALISNTKLQEAFHHLHQRPIAAQDVVMISRADASFLLNFANANKACFPIGANIPWTTGGPPSFVDKQQQSNLFTSFICADAPAIAHLDASHSRGLGMISDRLSALEKKHAHIDLGSLTADIGKLKSQMDEMGPIVGDIFTMLKAGGAAQATAPVALKSSFVKISMRFLAPFNSEDSPALLNVINHLLADAEIGIMVKAAVRVQTIFPWCIEITCASPAQAAEFIKNKAKLTFKNGNSKTKANIKANSDRVKHLLTNQPERHGWRATQDLPAWIVENRTNFSFSPILEGGAAAEPEGSLHLHTAAATKRRHESPAGLASLGEDPDGQPSLPKLAKNE